ncbi:MAG: CHAP domain-containing protein [Bacteroidales bacterium]|nr:CHAP domain-containing protein [Bacteroidales bacterium]
MIRYLVRRLCFAFLLCCVSFFYTQHAFAKANGFPVGYCTRYAAEKFDTSVPEPGLDWPGNAGQWYVNARIRDWATSNNPMHAEKGAIIVWDGGPEGYGHVAIVETVRLNEKLIVISEMNWAGLGNRTTATLSMANLNRGENALYDFVGFIFPRKAAAQCFTGEYGGSAVQYIKNQNPGGYNWKIMYPRLQGFSVNKNAGQKTWSTPSQIWYELQTSSKGSLPKVNSVMVIGDGSAWGHAAIVTKIDGDKVYVRHSNWECENRGLVTEGYFRLLDGGQKVAYNDGHKSYRLIGFIYKPWGISKIARDSQQEIEKKPVWYNNFFQKIMDFFK